MNKNHYQRRNINKKRPTVDTTSVYVCFKISRSFRSLSPASSYSSCCTGQHVNLTNKQLKTFSTVRPATPRRQSTRKSYLLLFSTASITGSMPTDQQEAHGGTIGAFIIDASLNFPNPATAMSPYLK